MTEDIPQDLGLVIGTKEEVVWDKVRTATTQRIEEIEADLIINKEMLKLAEEKCKNLNSTNGKKKS